jgi:hypothetical protein
MVPTVPNEVPNKKETSVLSKKAKRMKSPGMINDKPLYTIQAMVPDENHNPIKIPMSIKICTTGQVFMAP